MILNEKYDELYVCYDLKSFLKFVSAESNVVEKHLCVKQFLERRNVV